MTAMAPLAQTSDVAFKLEIPDDARRALLAMTPATYIGNAADAAVKHLD